MKKAFFRSALLLLVSFLSWGCRTTYEECLRPVRADFYAGRLESALQRIDDLLQDAGKNRPLYLLERAVVLQRMERYEDSAKDLEAVDQTLEVLDFEDDTSGTVTEFIFSPGYTLYRGQPHEKILLNTLNMVNFLAEGELTGARVEARRAEEMYAYQVDVEQRYHYRNPLTMLLYGLVFEASGRPNDAYLAYKQAFEMTGADFLKPRLLHTARVIGHSDYRTWLKRFGNLPPPVPEGWGNVLVVVMNGRAPIRVAQQTRIPAPLMNITHEGVSVAALGLKTVRYPALVRNSHRYHGGRLRIDGGDPRPLVQGVDIEGQALARFQDELPKIIAACVTRLLVRSVVSGAAASAIQGKEKGNEQDQFMRSMIEGFIDSALSTLDVPDLRCWNLLPAEILVRLEAAPAGKHTVSLEMTDGTGRTLQKEVEVKPRGVTVVPFFVTE